MLPVANHKELREKLAGLKRERELAEASVKRFKRDVEDLAVREQDLLSVALLFRSLTDREVVEGVKAIETLVTEGLQAIFPDQDLSVKADVSVSRGKVSVDLVTVDRKQNGLVVEGDPLDSFGGSVQTVESLLLRIITITKRGLRPLILLDETFTAFDDCYTVNAAAFMSRLCKDLGLDILVVTQNPVLIETADTAYTMHRDSDGSGYAEATP